MVVLMHIKQNWVGALFDQYIKLDIKIHQIENRVAMKDASTGATHYFVIEDNGKKISINQICHFDDKETQI